MLLLKDGVLLLKDGVLLLMDGVLLLMDGVLLLLGHPCGSACGKGSRGHPAPKKGCSASLDFKNHNHCTSLA